MRFIGQPHIMNQLKVILPTLHQTGEGACILLRGPSGWGKTTMAFGICNYLANGEFSFYLGNNFSLNKKHRVHFIDEVHLLQNPEILYPIIDSMEYVFVLATNDVAIVPEALVNRSMEFIFDQYSKEELRDICKTHVLGDLPVEFLDYIIDSSGGNPRIIKGLMKRINMFYLNSPQRIKGIDLNGFKKIMEDIFGIVDGLDVTCARYLEALQSVGGTASLQTLSTMLHIDKGSLQYHAEPILLYKNRIKITNKGRSLI